MSIEITRYARKHGIDDEDGEDPLNTTDEDRAIFEDCERGWPEERLNAARSVGAGVIEVLPDNLAARLSTQAEAGGRSTLDVISEAVEKLLADRHVA